jgi:hypothetical protein
MTLFTLQRHVDVSGTSGTGVVAQGVIFDDGTVAMRWLPNGARSTCLYTSIEDVLAIHGHGGRTVVVTSQGAIHG